MRSNPLSPCPPSTASASPRTSANTSINLRAPALATLARSSMLASSCSPMKLLVPAQPVRTRRSRAPSVAARPLSHASADAFSKKASRKRSACAKTCPDARPRSMAWLRSTSSPWPAQSLRRGVPGGRCGFWPTASSVSALKKASLRGRLATRRCASCSKNRLRPHRVKHEEISI